MNTVELREKLHTNIDEANDHVLNQVMDVFEEKFTQEDKLRHKMIERARSSEDDILNGRTITEEEFSKKVDKWIQDRRGLKLNKVIGHKNE